MATPITFLGGIAIGIAFGVAGTMQYQKSAVKRDTAGFSYAEEVCGPGYTNCEVTGLHKTLESCEFSIKMGNMLCNHNNPEQVICKPVPTHQLAAVGRCDRLK